MTPNEYFERAKAIVGIPSGSDVTTFKLQWASVAEAQTYLSKIRLMQKQLKLLKSSLIADEKIARSEYVQRRVEVGSPGIGNSLLRGFFGAKATGKLNTLNRESIRQEQNSAMQPYDAVKRLLDELVIQLDSTKIELQSKLLDNNQSNNIAVEAEQDSVEADNFQRPEVDPPVSTPSLSVVSTPSTGLRVFVGDESASRLSTPAKIFITLTGILIVLGTAIYVFSQRTNKNSDQRIGRSATPPTLPPNIVEDSITEEAVSPPRPPKEKFVPATATMPVLEKTLINDICKEFLNDKLAAEKYYRGRKFQLVATVYKASWSPDRTEGLCVVLNTEIPQHIVMAWFDRRHEREVLTLKNGDVVRVTGTFGEVVIVKKKSEVYVTLDQCIEAKKVDH